MWGIWFVMISLDSFAEHGNRYRPVIQQYQRLSCMSVSRAAGFAENAEQAAVDPSDGDFRSKKPV